MLEYVYLDINSTLFRQKDQKAVKRNFNMKKHGIKLSAIALALTFLIFTGCSSAPALSFAGAYFLPDPSAVTVGDVNETCEYTLSFEKGKREDISFTLAPETSFYKTKLEKSSYGEQLCYKLTTQLSYDGTYSIKGKSDVAVKNAITTEAYFSALKDKLKPIFSRRTAKAYSPTIKNGEFEIKYYDYVLETTYSGNDASVKFTAENFADGDYSLVSGSVTEYKNLYTTNYFDNETALFLPRTLSLGTSSITYNSIDGLSKTVRSMKLSPAETATAKLEFSSYTTNSKNIAEVAADVVTFSLNETYSGSALTAYYAQKNDTQSQYSRLLKLEVNADYGIGKFTYIIKSASYGA